MPLSGNETEALPPTKRPFRTTKHCITKRDDVATKAKCFATKTKTLTKNS